MFSSGQGAARRKPSPLQQLDYRSTIAGSSKNNSKKKNVKNINLSREKNENRINYFFQYFPFVSHLGSFLLIFFAQNKN